VNKDDVGSVIQLAFSGRLSPAVDSDYFNDTSSYVEKLKEIIHND
jgi:hypothetical protein